MNINELHSAHWWQLTLVTINLTRLTRYSFFLSLALVKYDARFIFKIKWTGFDFGTEFTAAWSMSLLLFYMLFLRLEDNVNMFKKILSFTCIFFFNVVAASLKIHCYTSSVQLPIFFFLASHLIINLETKVNGNIWFISWNWSEKKSLSFNPKLNFRFFSVEKKKIKMKWIILRKWINF